MSCFYDAEFDIIHAQNARFLYRSLLIIRIVCIKYAAYFYWVMIFNNIKCVHLSIVSRFIPIGLFHNFYVISMKMELKEINMYDKRENMCKF